MATVTLNGLWPTIRPAKKQTTRKSGKTVMERFIENQERRAKVRVSQILGSYDVDALRATGLNDEQIRQLISSRFAGTR